MCWVIFQSDAEGFYEGAATMARNKSWGLYPGWAYNYGEAAANYNGTNLSQVSSVSTGGYVIAGGYYRTASGAPTTVNGKSGDFKAYYVGGNGSENVRKRMNWNNSKLALDIGGGTYRALGDLTSSQGQWLGKNGKYYNNSWGGNQYTGSRSGAFKAVRSYKLVGKAVIGVSTVIGVAETFNGYQADGGRFGYMEDDLGITHRVQRHKPLAV